MGLCHLSYPVTDVKKGRSDAAVCRTVPQDYIDGEYESAQFGSVDSDKGLCAYGCEEYENDNKCAWSWPKGESKLLNAKAMFRCTQLAKTRCRYVTTDQQSSYNHYRKQGHSLSSQIHRCRCRHRRCRRIRSRYWIRLRFPHHRLCPQPIPQTTTFLLRHSGIRPFRSHGSFLSYDGLPAFVRFLNIGCRNKLSR